MVRYEQVFDPVSMGWVNEIDHIDEIVAARKITLQKTLLRLRRDFGKSVGRKGESLNKYETTLKRRKPIYRDAIIEGYVEGFKDFLERKIKLDHDIMSLDTTDKTLSAKQAQKALSIYTNARAIGLSGAVFDIYAKSVKAMRPAYRKEWVRGYLDGYNEYHDKKHKKE